MTLTSPSTCAPPCETIRRRLKPARRLRRSDRGGDHMAQLHADVSSPLSFRRPIVRRAVESKIFSSEWQFATVSLAGDAQVCHLERSGTAAVIGERTAPRSSCTPPRRWIPAAVAHRTSRCRRYGDYCAFTSLARTAAAFGNHRAPYPADRWRFNASNSSCK